MAILMFFSKMTCNKRKYDKIGAMWALVSCRHKRNSKHNMKRGEKRIYYCEECHAWHLTHLD